MATAKPPVKTKGGNVILKRIDTPDNVSPGGEYSVDVVVGNGAFTIGPLDPDLCRSDNVSGYKLRVVVVDATGKEHVAGPVCQPITTIGVNTETYSFDVQAPQSDYAEVEAHVEMVESEKETDAIVGESLVTSEDPKQPDKDQPDDDDDNDEEETENLSPLGDYDDDGVINSLDPEPRNSDVPSGGGPFNIGGQLDKLLLIAGVIALAWAADSGAEVLS